MSICTGIYHGTDAEWDQTFQAAQGATDTSLKNDLIAGLTCARDANRQRAFLNDQLSANNILTTMINVANRPGGYLVSWDFLKINWDNLYSRFSTSSSFPTLIRDISQRLRYDAQLNDVKPILLI